MHSLAQRSRPLGPRRWSKYKSWLLDSPTVTPIRRLCQSAKTARKSAAADTLPSKHVTLFFHGRFQPHGRIDTHQASLQALRSRDRVATGVDGQGAHSGRGLRRALRCGDRLRRAARRANGCGQHSHLGCYRSPSCGPSVAPAFWRTTLCRRRATRAKVHRFGSHFTLPALIFLGFDLEASRIFALGALLAAGSAFCS